LRKIVKHSRSLYNKEAKKSQRKYKKFLKTLDKPSRLCYNAKAVTNNGSGQRSGGNGCESGGTDAGVVGTLKIERQSFVRRVCESGQVLLNP
jgi:hypothetical protein